MAAELSRGTCVHRVGSSEREKGARRLGHGPARGPWTNLGRLPLRVFSIGKYAFQKKKLSWQCLEVRDGCVHIEVPCPFSTTPAGYEVQASIRPDRPVGREPGAGTRRQTLSN